MTNSLSASTDSGFKPLDLSTTTSKTTLATPDFFYTREMKIEFRHLSGFSPLTEKVSELAPNIIATRINELIQRVVAGETPEIEVDRNDTQGATADSNWLTIINY